MISKESRIMPQGTELPLAERYIRPINWVGLRISGVNHPKPKVPHGITMPLPTETSNSPIVDISFAIEKDTPALAHIGVVALRNDLIHRIIFTASIDNDRAEKELENTLKKELHNPKACIVKATLKGTDKIVGYLYVYRNDSDKEILSAPSSTVYSTLGSLMMRILKKKQCDLLAGQKHWGTTSDDLCVRVRLTNLSSWKAAHGPTGLPAERNWPGHY
jgi:hypothetical protein